MCYSIYLFTHTHTFAQNTHTHTRIHACTPMQSRAHTRTHTHTGTHEHTGNTQANIHTHTHSHTQYMQTQTHIHTVTSNCVCSAVQLRLHIYKVVSNLSMLDNIVHLINATLSRPCGSSQNEPTAWTRLLRNRHDRLEFPLLPPTVSAPVLLLPSVSLHLSPAREGTIRGEG